MCISFSRDRKNKNRACLLSTTNEDPWRFLLNIMESVYILHCLEVIAPSRFLCSSVLTLLPPSSCNKNLSEGNNHSNNKNNDNNHNNHNEINSQSSFLFCFILFFLLWETKKIRPEKKRREICCGFEEKDSISWWCQICLNLYIYIYIIE